jgi:exopolyphosphatase/guanosine-5'-triphosphate,3'-diphosphate pyrophosphatase
MYLPENIAVIDLGTNTFHLLIAELTVDDTFIIKEKYKELVKLGEGGITGGIIAEPAFERGIQALIKFRKIIDTRDINHCFAYATSALRGASNGKAFVEKALQFAQIPIKIISGSEEAALIFKGVRNGVQLPYDEDVLVIDIGGGSVEFIVGNHTQVKLLRSLKIGAQRLLEQIKPDDPITIGQIKETIAIYTHEMADLIEELQDFRISKIVGSSGTFETLGALIANEKKEKYALGNLNGYRFDQKLFKSIHTRLLNATRNERLQMPGMEPVRVDMILFGSILVDLLVDRLHIEQITVSAYALKEGILYNYLEEGRIRRHDAAERSLREKEIRALGQRFEIELPHVELVRHLAASIFDQLQPLHGYGPDEKEYLIYSALLHDIGYFINRSGHHKHGQYILMNSGLPGFSSDELLLIGNIIRYHRKSLPSREHMHYNILYKDHKTAVRRLAGILRIAANLDRTRRSIVKDVKLDIKDQKIDMIVIAVASAELEIEHANAEKLLFEQAFERQVNIFQGELVNIEI